MRIRNMKSRYYKSLLGKKLFRKMVAGSRLRVDDLIHTCSGFNKRISKIERYKFSWRRESGTDDLLLSFTDGMQCSWVHCCAKAQTTSQITSYFLRWTEQDLQRYQNMGYVEMVDDIRNLQSLIKAGEPICNENGERLFTKEE